MGDNSNTIIYKTKHTFTGIFLSILALIIWYGANVMRQAGAPGLTIFMILLGLSLLIFGISIFSQEEELAFDFVEKTISYYKHSRKEKVDNLKIGFDQIKHLLLLTGSEQGGGAGTVIHHGKIVFNEAIDKLPHKNELEILCNLDKRIVAKKLNIIAERGGFEIVSD